MTSAASFRDSLRMHLDHWILMRIARLLQVLSTEVEGQQLWLQGLTAWSKRIRMIRTIVILFQHMVSNNCLRSFWNIFAFYNGSNVMY
jgi:hypothetical protein